LVRRLFEMKPVKQILLVDDHELFRDTFKEIITEKFPHLVIEWARDGDEAHKKIAASRPDLILMDIALPGKNGLELTREIKESHGDIKIVILTGLGSGYEKAAHKYGADGYLVKGISGLEEIFALFGPALPFAD
jgi:DNA-binding NarL/FixJ family response regulator